MADVDAGPRRPPLLDEEGGRRGPASSHHSLAERSETSAGSLGLRGLPNWMFRPATRESDWVSRRTLPPETSLTVPLIALRKPWTQAVVRVMSSVSFRDVTRESVLVVMPGAWTLNR